MVDDAGPYATPFLNVIVDPRAAGPHTLAALRGLYRLLERGSVVQVSRLVVDGGGGGGGAGGDEWEAAAATTRRPSRR